MSQIDPGTPSWLRSRNDREALRLFLEHGPLTRSRLGELTGMSKPTATQIIGRLARAELLYPAGEVSSNRGPNAQSWGVRGDRITGVAVHMLADIIQAVLVDATDADYPLIDIAAEGEERSPEQDIARAIRAACAAADVDVSTVEVVTVGVQAAVSRDHDRLSLTDSLPGWPSVGARARIQERLGVEVTLENDVNLATMAERALGVAQDAESFALLWVGVGLGVGVDLGGSIHRGAHGSAGEVGYLAVATEAGEPAAVTTDLIGADVILDVLGAPAGADYPAGVRGLATNEQALELVAQRVSLTIEPVLAVLDPEMVVLGGPTSLAGGQRLAELVSEYSKNPERPAPVVRLSTTGDRSVLVGARRLLVEQIRSRLEDRIPTT